jgi:tyrosyl-tRNA synthetase
MNDVIAILKERGFINQCTDLDNLTRVAEKPLTAYIGFDLTASSLHVGSLIQIMALRWLEKIDHRPLVLLGEATTRIGDPTGKTAARPILSPNEIATNRNGIARVFERLLSSPEFVSNAEWLNDETSLFSYLTEFGSLFTVNRMVSFDTVKSRLDNHQPMSFLEFNYMLFQAIDFLELFGTRDCRLQIGGSDQWGNIVNGVELIRRKHGETAFGLTTPLMTNSAGEKMGKTATGAVWLDPTLTSPFDFWQFWRNIEDTKVGEFLGLFTEIPMDEVTRLASLSGAEINEAKKVLASEVTRIVHGVEAAAQAERDSLSVFEHGQTAASLPVIEVRLNDMETTTIADAFLDCGLVNSKSEADRLARQGGLKIEDISYLDARVPLSTLGFGGEFRLAAGKKRRALLRVRD